MNNLEKFFEHTTEQENDSRLARLLEHNAAVRDNWQLVSAVKEALAAEDYIEASMLWSRAPETVKESLWVAPTKGGIFTTKERQQLKSNEMHSATQAQFTEQTAWATKSA